MGTRQVRIEYSGVVETDIDEGAIVDDLAIGLGDADEATDEQIDAAIRRDIDSFMDQGDVDPPSHSYVYDRDRLIESVRAEIARRRAEASE